MAGWLDLVEAAEPVLCYAQGGGTIGASWRFRLQLLDSTGAPLPLTTLGVSGVCTVYSSRDGEGSALATMTVTVDDDGTVTCSMAEADTALLGPCPSSGWALNLTNPAASSGQQKIQVFAAQNSPFPIRTEG